MCVLPLLTPVRTIQDPDHVALTWFVLFLNVSMTLWLTAMAVRYHAQQLRAFCKRSSQSDVSVSERSLSAGNGSLMV